LAGSATASAMAKPATAGHAKRNLDTEVHIIDHLLECPNRGVSAD